MELFALIGPLCLASFHVFQVRSCLSYDSEAVPGCGCTPVSAALKLLYIHRFSVDGDQLVVTDVGDHDSGTYTCVANTTLDMVSASAVLSVVGKNCSQETLWAALKRQTVKCIGSVRLLHFYTMNVDELLLLSFFFGRHF